MLGTRVEAPASVNDCRACASGTPPPRGLPLRLGSADAQGSLACAAPLGARASHRAMDPRRDGERTGTEMLQRAVSGTVLAGAILLAGCAGDGGGSGGDDDLNGSGSSFTVTVAFQSYCQSQTVTVYQTDTSGSSCTPVDVSTPLQPAAGAANAYSASTTGMPDCAQGTRVEITPGSDGDVSYDISTNAAVMNPPFFNVAVQFLCAASPRRSARARRVRPPTRRRPAARSSSRATAPPAPTWWSGVPSRTPRLCRSASHPPSIRRVPVRTSAGRTR